MQRHCMCDHRLQSGQPASQPEHHQLQHLNLEAYHLQLLVAGRQAMYCTVVDCEQCAPSVRSMRHCLLPLLPLPVLLCQ